jgi:ribosome-binding factor A
MTTNEKGRPVSTHRRQRVGDVVRQVLARALREEVRDPRVGFVTLTGVDLSPDLRHARVFVSTLEPEAEREETLRALRRAAPYLRRTLAREGGLKYVPRLEFRFDTSIETGARLEELLGELRSDDDD